MPGRLNAAEFELLPRKIVPCSVDEVFQYVQPKYRTRDLALLRRFQKGCH